MIAERRCGRSGTVPNMARLPVCPHCRFAPAHQIEDKREAIHYGLCPECGHVWNVPRGHPDAKSKAVTPRPTKRAELVLGHHLPH